MLSFNFLIELGKVPNNKLYVRHELICIQTIVTSTIYICYLIRIPKLMKFSFNIFIILKNIFKRKTHEITFSLEFIYNEFKITVKIIILDLTANYRFT